MPPELIGISFLEAFEPDLFDEALRDPPLGRGHPLELEPELDVAPHSEPREQRVALEIGRARPRAGDRPPTLGDRAEVGRSSPAIRRSSVDLPQPDGPTMRELALGNRERDVLEPGDRRALAAGEAHRDVLDQELAQWAARGSERSPTTAEPAAGSLNS